MTDRENLQNALNHKEPARLPVDFGGHGCSAIHVTCIAALRDYYGLPKELIKVTDPYSMTGEIGDDLKKAMGISVEGVPGYSCIFGTRTGKVAGWKEWKLDNGFEMLISDDFAVTRSKDGGYDTYPQGDTTLAPSGHMPKDGFYFDSIIRQDPLPDDDSELNIEDQLEEYQPITDAELAFYANESRLAAATGRGVVMSVGGAALGDIAFIPGSGLKHPKGIRSIEEWYISPLIRPDYMKEVFRRQTDLALENLEKLSAAVGDNVDAVLVCGTDFGTQKSQFLSVDTFKDIYMPYYKKVNDWIHAHTNWKTIKHSCGAVEPLIGSFIESGFDCLNPVQCSAAGMDARYLKKTYGKDIVFWGGGVDTQQVLQFGTKEDVRRQVLERCETFAPGGGFVFNAIHCVQCGTPAENIVAMVDAVREFQ